MRKAVLVFRQASAGIRWIAEMAAFKRFCRSLGREPEKELLGLLREKNEKLEKEVKEHEKVVDGIK